MRVNRCMNCNIPVDIIHPQMGRSYVWVYIIYDCKHDSGGLNMAASFAAVSSTSTGFGEGSSYYDQIMALDSKHKNFMAQKLCYKVYVHSPFVNHHCLVLAEKENRCEHVTIELTVIIDGETRQIAPKAQLYNSGLQGLVYKGEVCTSLEHICEVAYLVLIKMGSYNLAFNNCQHFCNNVLKEFGLPGHTTDTATIGIGAALLGGAVGVAAAGYALYKYLSTNDSDSHEKEKRKNLK